ncbi:MAG: outer membrane lipoprotein-sorting protein [Candidatus Glassbacteria bacterium]
MNSSLRIGLTVISLSLCLTPLISSGSWEAADEPSVNEIIKKIDLLYRSKSSYAEIEMEITTPHWQRTLAMNIWTEEMEKTLIRITAPKKEQGVATLRIGSEMWNYLPKTNKVVKVPPSMMMSSWMGSDFTNDDLVKEFSLFEDYSYEFASPEDGREDLYYIKCIPREDLAVVWGYIVIACRKNDYLPVWQKYYDEKDNLMRILSYSDIRAFDGRTIPAVMEMVPQNKEGHKTTIRYVKARFDVDIDEDMFSLRRLRSRP